MKKLLLSLVVGFLPFLSFGAGPQTLKFSGPFTVNLTALQQAASDVLVKSNYTHTATTTNIAQLHKSTIKKFAFSSASLVTLLGNSFNTNLPPGARLVTDGIFIYVMDKTGTNVLLNVTSVLQVNFTDAVTADLAVDTLNLKKTGATQKNTDVGAQVSFANVSYDDSALTTKDSTHSVFTITGVFNESFSRNFDTGKTSESFVTTDGAGNGTVQGTNTIIFGTSTGKATGIELAF